VGPERVPDIGGTPVVVDHAVPAERLVHGEISGVIVQKSVVLDVFLGR